MRKKIFADDLKLYLQMYSINDSVELLSELNRFYSRYTTIQCKCSKKNFSRRKLNLKFKYTNSFNLTGKTQMKDLGILLSNNLSFNKIILYNKALRVFGFV